LLEEPRRLKNLENWWISTDFPAEPLKKRRILANIRRSKKHSTLHTLNNPLEKWLFQSANTPIPVQVNVVLTTV
jgi:hypothetical protein